MEDKTWHFHITGQVQGIGFRPFIYRLAQFLGINGDVNNDPSGVHINFTSTKEKADVFVSKILQTAPTLSIITSSELKQVDFKAYDHFSIIKQSTKSSSQVAITPDFALCADCKHDLIHSRRNDYPFISCTQCGPRYSIARHLPFEREHTAMNSFILCETCAHEYADQNDRRFHAQTISCPKCGIQLQLVDSNKQTIHTDTAGIINLIPTLWREGKIIAIKGIGGFLLTCGANNAVAIQKLRARKHRPTKPFAVMIPSLDDYPSLKNTSIYTALSDHISPIVLCPKQLINDDFSYVAEDLDTIGLMIPYAPIFEILLRTFKQPIVATSGNTTNLPITYKNADAIENLTSIADYVLLNNRDILMPQDDSVIAYTPSSNQKIVLRRSRGMAPNCLKGYSPNDQESILCLGAELKSTFTISHLGNIYISQYIGKLGSIESQEHYTTTLSKFLDLLQTQPSYICTDTHPKYFTQQLGTQLAQKFNAPITKIQHHKAHFAAILGEHNLLDSSNQILGVIWDGTGLGEDGMIWGSEYFIYKDYSMKRCGHLNYYPHFLQDKMALEPRISSLAILYGEEAGTTFIQHKFTDEEWRIYTALIKKDNVLQTSSMGRLFDAAASVLGLIDKQSYEGEAAMQLETVARQHTDLHGFDSVEPYSLNYKNGSNGIAKYLLIQMITDIRKEKSNGLIAAKFHMSLVKWITDVATKEACYSLAFSGGVFQNSLLVDVIHYKCAKDYTLYFHHDLSPNDENISYGQYIYFQMSQKLMEKN